MTQEVVATNDDGRPWWECSKPVTVADGVYRYDCADCRANDLGEPSSITIHAATRREAEALVRTTSRCDGYTDEDARLWRGWFWRLRRQNDFTAPGWVCPCCNYRVKDSERDARENRAERRRFRRR